MSPYAYLPAAPKGKIRTLFLDANVVGHLDSVAQRGLEYANPVVRERLGDLVRRLAPDVLVSPGLGAGESVIRRNDPLKLVSNYTRRSHNAIRLLGEDRAELDAWLRSEACTQPRAPRPDRDIAIPGENFGIVHANLLLPSYAVVLKTYQLHLAEKDPIASLRELESFCAELFARGSRELLLGTLLLTGTGEGIQLASNIMKTSKMSDTESTLTHLWNTSFDLTHSRLVAQASVPGFTEHLPGPRAFVTDDRMLGKLLERIDHLGALHHSGGGGVSADNVRLTGYVRPELADEVTSVILKSSLSVRDEKTNPDLMSRIRRHKARTYAAQIEAWFFHRFEGAQPPQAG